MSRAVPVLWLFLASVLIGASIGFAARANADSLDDYTYLVAGDICAEISAKPSPKTVDYLIAEVNADTGWGTFPANRVVGLAVTGYCPQFTVVLQRHADPYGPIGGRLK